MFRNITKTLTVCRGLSSTQGPQIAGLYMDLSIPALVELSLFFLGGPLIQNGGGIFAGWWLCTLYIRIVSRLAQVLHAQILFVRMQEQGVGHCQQMRSEEP